MKIFAKLLFLLLLMPFITFAAEDSFHVGPEVIGAAEHAFDQGQFDEAIKLYEQAWSAGRRSGSLLLNLGMAYLESGKHGQAVAALLGAKRLAPRDEMIPAALQKALNSSGITPEAIYSLTGGSIIFGVTFWGQWITARELWNIGIWIFGMAGVLIALDFASMKLKFRERIDSKKMRFWFSSVAGAAVFLLILSLLTEAYQPHWSAVTEDKAMLLPKPDGQSAAVKELHQGAPLFSLGRVEGFVHVRTIEADTGWISDRSIRSF